MKKYHTSYDTIKKIFDKNNITIINKQNRTVHCVRYGCTPAIANIEAIYYKTNIFLTRKYNKYLQIRNCRFKAKALKLLEGKIGEG